jgi:hypothetical protein
MYYDTTHDPPYPAARIRISTTIFGQFIQLAPINVLIDTGADRTCIPPSAIPPQYKLPYAWHKVNAGGNVSRRKFYVLLNAKVEFIDNDENLLLEKIHPRLELLEFDEGLLGRDIIMHYVCEFHGPNQNCVVRNP